MKTSKPWRAAAILVLAASAILNLGGAASRSEPPRFEVRIAPGSGLAGEAPRSGRVLVALGQPGFGAPRNRLFNTDPPVLPLLGRDAERFGEAEVVVLDKTATGFPHDGLARLEAGEYQAQAFFHHNRDIALATAPGNLFSQPVRFRFDPKSANPQTIKLELSQAFPNALPEDSKSVKFLHFPSKRLSDFHGRPMVYRAAVVLPPNFDREPDRKYLLRVHIGGFGTRYTSARFMRPDPRFVQVLLDGAGPFGDPYHVDSANNGPYGAALTEELIPHIESQYRCVGTPNARFTDGASTGGWVSLALQIFYPDVFNGCWSQCPDSVDFRNFELVNIYEDANAFTTADGRERPSKREPNGKVIFNLRHELQIEKALGLGDRWTLSGRDWGSWNASYGPRGADGLPKPIWDGETGAIDRSVLDHWRKYDLRLILENHWKTLGPKLRGKIHIWVGDGDDYYLNHAVERLKTSAEALRDPKFDGEIVIAPGQGHTTGWSERHVLDAMAKRGPKVSPSQ